ncbi:MAG: hypothetical protein ACSLFQ_11825 [Thermoanaerobaculia bacterium]
MKTMPVLFAISLLALPACSKPAQPSETAAASQASKQADPHASVTDTSLALMTEAASSPAEAAIAYDFPEGWTRVKPKSMMRMDQATIVGPGGDGELAVFFFGTGGGGGVQANLDRWAEQIDGGTPVTSAFEHGGYKISWVESAGTLIASGMGGSSESMPNYRLLGAVVEGEGGPWFFKATGPDATMTAQKESFLAMLRTVRPNAAATKKATF